MNTIRKKRKFLICFILIVFILTFTYTIWSLEKDTKDTLQQKREKIITKNTISLKNNITKEYNVEVAQRNLDRSISILNTVATLMGVLVGLLTLTIVIGGSLGFFEYRRWREVRQQAEESAGEVRKSYEEVKPIVERIRKAEEEVNNMRTQIQIPPLAEKPSKETKEKFDDYAKRIEFLETFGVSLKPEDYLSRGIDLYYKAKYELALKAFDKAIELKPDYTDAWVVKGAVLGNLNRYKEELKTFDKAIELKPDYAGGWYNRACVYSLKSDKENALANLSKAIKLDTKYKEKAKKDEDYKNLWKDDEFKKITS